MAQLTVKTCYILTGQAHLVMTVRVQPWTTGSTEERAAKPKTSRSTSVFLDCKLLILPGTPAVLLPYARGPTKTTCLEASISSAILENPESDATQNCRSLRVIVSTGRLREGTCRRNILTWFLKWPLRQKIRTLRTGVTHTGCFGALNMHRWKPRLNTMTIVHRIKEEKLSSVLPSTDTTSISVQESADLLSVSWTKTWITLTLLSAVRTDMHFQMIIKAACSMISGWLVSSGVPTFCTRSNENLTTLHLGVWMLVKAMCNNILLQIALWTLFYTKLTHMFTCSKLIILTLFF